MLIGTACWPQRLSVENFMHIERNHKIAQKEQHKELLKNADKKWVKVNECYAPRRKCSLCKPRKNSSQQLTIKETKQKLKYL